MLMMVLPFGTINLWDFLHGRFLCCRALIECNSFVIHL